MTLTITPTRTGITLAIRATTRPRTEIVRSTFRQPSQGQTRLRRLTYRQAAETRAVATLARVEIPTLRLRMAPAPAPTTFLCLGKCLRWAAGRPERSRSEQQLSPQYRGAAG